MVSIAITMCHGVEREARGRAPLTATHPNLSQLSRDDPDGDRLRAEVEQCDATLREHLGVTPRDFAFTGTSWSSVAEREVKQRYRFGRLWIVGAMYEVDGQPMRY